MARRLLLATASCLALLAVTSASALATTPQPVWEPTVTSLPTVLKPGAPEEEVFIAVPNLGAEVSSGPITVTDQVPVGLEPTEVKADDTDPTLLDPNDPHSSDPSCAPIAGQAVTCTFPGPIHPSRQLRLRIFVAVGPTAEGTLQNALTVQGGGAPPATVSTPIEIGDTLPPFGFLPGFLIPSLETDGSASMGAGAHPYSLATNFLLPTQRGTKTLSADGHVKTIAVDFPPGQVIDPTATPLRCSEAELITEDGPGRTSCPPASQVGIISILGGEVTPITQTSPLYNMVPPPGSGASLGFDAFGAGVFIHVLGGVRSDGDYGITGTTFDTLGLTNHPIFGARVELWGDPTDPVHDELRSFCAFGFNAAPCQAGQRAHTPLLTNPTQCTGQPLLSRARADSWEEPGVFKEATYESADLDGNPVSISGCDALEFEPTITAQPTTNLTDSPSGLDVDLHQPQNTELDHLATATLRDATVALPEGLSVNPSQADGLQACSNQQIGFLSEKEGIHFSKDPPSCPDASKLGTMEVTTPLLAQYSEDGTTLQTDPQSGEAIPRPLKGSVYLAQPNANPLHSLLAIYLSVEDPQSGTYAKLAGEVITDPATGQITTVFEENPQLPLEDVKLHLFGGARGSLITPPTCATHTTTTDLVPWSAPETPDAEPEDSFTPAASPVGGSCPTSEGAQPAATTFTAGTLSPQAGAFSPFVLKLSREDGTQRLTGFDTVLPPGLSGKLAGVAQCSDAQIARAAARSGLEEGILERQDPSCPTTSRLGTVTVAAGAGPNPFNTQGTAYLAGPYKSAPLSMVVITPALAGPFDLGTVVVRAALNVNPDTAQIHAVSDPFPTILHGIPLDLRSVAVSLDRPSFTLNPTSCNEMQITGSATSLFNATIPLTQRFQVGGCPQLPFKPKLSLQLKGKTKRTSHPTLIANLKARPGDANIAKAQVKLPGAAFLDQGHIGTVCTRVQFAAKACPPASIYGTVSATTPLLDYTLTGNVYLRSSSHQLPDLVADLNGPTSQPIEIALAGRTDAVKGALRNTFEAVPDQPVSKFHLELFGGKRGLIILSSGLCKSPKATVKLDGQNGKAFDTTPTVKTSCPKKKAKHPKHHKRGGGER